MASETQKLKSLADEVRGLLDDPAKIASDEDKKPSERWQGPNATKVRGELRVRRGKLRTLADEISAEATRRKHKDKKGDAPD